MSRLVKHDEQRPWIIKQEEVDRWPLAICACGLSASKPYCDGSHKATQDERPGVLYRYTDDDDEKGREEVQA